MKKIKFIEDGQEMWVPEEDVIWTIIQGQVTPVILLGGGWSIVEFEDLSLDIPLNERIKIVEARRQEALNIIYD